MKAGLRVTGAQALLIIIMAAAMLVLPGSDIYTHLHQAWLYNHMLDNKALLVTDFSMLSGNQQIYGIGIPAYLIAGIARFALGNSSIKVLELAMFAALITVSLLMFRDRRMLFFWYA